MNKEIDILLVEDNLADAELTVYALTQKNLANKLLHVHNGAEALDYLFREGRYVDTPFIHNPKLILLDLKMPKLGGLEVLNKIRADERTKNIPVVVLTSSKEDPDIQKCYDLGVNSYVVKPVNFDAFQEAVAELGLYWMIVNQQPNYT